MKHEFRVNGTPKLALVPENQTESYLLRLMCDAAQKGITYTMTETEGSLFSFVPKGTEHERR